MRRLAAALVAVAASLMPIDVSAGPLVDLTLGFQVLDRAAFDDSPIFPPPGLRVDPVVQGAIGWQFGRRHAFGIGVRAPSISSFMHRLRGLGFYRLGLGTLSRIPLDLELGLGFLQNVGCHGSDVCLVQMVLTPHLGAAMPFEMEAMRVLVGVNVAIPDANEFTIAGTFAVSFVLHAPGD